MLVFQTLWSGAGRLVEKLLASEFSRCTAIVSSNNFQAGANFLSSRILPSEESATLNQN